MTDGGPDRDADADEIEAVIHNLIDHLVLDAKCDGVVLALLGEYLCGLTQAATDVHAMAGIDPEAADVQALRPIMRERGYCKQYRYCMAATGLTPGDA